MSRSSRSVVVISLQGIRLNVNSIMRREMCKIEEMYYRLIVFSTTLINIRTTL
jgi:hypothetical protein